MALLPPRALIGMVHLPPLPGSGAAAWPLQEISAAACADARTLADAGFDAIIIENFGDAPFHPTRVPPETIAAMTLVTRAVRQAVALPLGINVLRNDPEAALAIATVCGAAFIRVNVHCGVYATDQGLIEGSAHSTLRYRQGIGSAALIFADVHVKHAVPLSCPDIAAAAEETAYRGRADGLIVSGPATGKPTDIADVQAVRAAVPDRPLLVGSGVIVQTVRDLLQVADGAIIGTALKMDERIASPVDPARAAAMVAAARS